MEDASAWAHFGANIGAAQGPCVRFSVTDGELERLTKSALEEVGTDPAEAVPRGTSAGAESQVVARHGGRVAAMVGSNALFHLESDRWPKSVDMGVVSGFATAFTGVNLQLAGS